MKTIGSSVEFLEARIAPATLVNPHTVTYDDINGNHVTVTVSKGDLTGRLTFLNGFESAGDQQLLTINLASPQFSGADLTTTAIGTGGAGFGDFGFLNAKGVDLGDVSLVGDVGKILAGDGNISTPAMGNLTAHNLGNSTNLGAPDFNSIIKGAVGYVNFNEINQGSLSVTGGPQATIKGMNAGQVYGGTAPSSGSVSVTGNMGPISVGGLFGGPGDNSGQIFVGGNLDNFYDAGPVYGSSGKSSGALIVKGSVNGISFLALSGGSGGGSGSISVGGSANVITPNAMMGGAGSDSGRIFVQGNLGSINALAVKGGSGDGSGSVVCGGAISTASFLSLTGDTGIESGRLRAAGLIGSVTIGQDLTGGSGDYAGSIRSDKGLQSISIDGGVQSGFGIGSGSIVTNGNIGTLDISGAVTGTIGAPVVISALGKLKLPTGTTTNVTIGTVSIGGDVKFLNVLAGYGLTGKALNADAQIDSISVAKTVTGSNFVAGISAGQDGLFGTADDTAIAGGRTTVLSKIASIVITGQTVPTIDTADAFGVVAQQVSYASIGGAVIPLAAGPGNDQGLALGAANDFKLREV